MSTNAPPCATCGQPLRWIAESYGWGCDRCRQFHPAGQVQAAAAAPSAQQPAQTGPAFQGQQYAPAVASAAPAGGKSNKGLFIALGGVALVGGVIAIVLVARGGGGGGGGSRDGTIKKVLSNLSSGDVDGLIALAPDASLIEKFEDCDKDAKKKKKSSDDDEEDEDDPAKKKKDNEKKIRKEVEKLVKKAKKAKFEIEEIVTKEPKAMTAEERECDEEDEDGDRKRKKKKKDEDDEDDDVKVLVIARKGCKTRKGCKANYDIRMQKIDVKVKITPDKEGAKSKTKKVAVNMIEVDGGWYVEDVKLPDMGGSSDDDDSSSGGGDDDDDDAIWTAMEGYSDRVCACKDMDCITKAGEEWAKKAGELAKKSSSATKPTKEQMEKAEKLTRKITECTKKVTMLSHGEEMMKKVEPPKPPESPEPPDDPDDSTSSGGGGTAPSGVVLSDPPSDMPATCKLYRTSIEKALKCPTAKLDAKMKGLFADGWNSFVKSWGMITDASMKASVGSSCDKMVEGMERTVASMCR